MVVIRLARGGSKKRPFYNVVVTDSRKRRDSHYIERVGFYNPVAAGADVRLHFEEDRVNFWVSKGAQMSDTVARLFKNRAALSAPETAEQKAAVAAKNAAKKAAAQAAADAKAAEEAAPAA
ncbi:MULTISPECIES: 30S ribosomal protein S16 [Mesosutterella]|uniref:Small ribosomal subunit protein bS16 n=1 Tax=Mesosutterella faecium TaxID=2925194 RepID=A0ABT7ILT2_9BURK|nr:MULTISPECIES: 30S ribosomal protein S16 [unclassified Mesosutterella]MDL2059322.1 30S ribosomal protein S16 [Mesosutterella sp. AGMB02718]